MVIHRVNAGQNIVHYYFDGVRYWSAYALFIFTLDTVYSHIWFFADVPHVMKNIRSHVLDDGLYLSGPRTADETPVLDRSLLMELVKVAAGNEFKMCFKLTERHITVRIVYTCTISSEDVL